MLNIFKSRYKKFCYIQPALSGGEIFYKVILDSTNPHITPVIVDIYKTKDGAFCGLSVLRKYLEDEE